MENNKEVNKNIGYVNKKPTLLIWTIIGILFLSVFSVLSVTYISDQEIKTPYLNITNSSYSLQRTYDVVVCKGNSVADNIIKSLTCDSVCYSTNTPAECSTKINAAVDGGNKTVLIRAGTYILDNSTSTTSRITICGDNNLVIRGEGIDKTILYNNGIHVNCATATRNIQISDLTINVNNSANNGLNFLVTNSGTYDVIVERVKLLNTSNAFLLHGAICGGIVKDSIFIDAGLVTLRDNVALTNPCPYRSTKFINNDVLKILSLGGAGLSNGGSYSLIIDNNYFEDASGTSYAAISLEGQSYNMSDIIITNNIINYSIGHTGDINIDDKGYSRTVKNVKIANNIINGGGINLAGDVSVEVAAVNDNNIFNSDYGIYVDKCLRACVISDNNLYNYNIFNYSAAGASSRALRVSYSNDTIIRNNVMTLDLDTSLGVYYGIRLIGTLNTTVIGNEFYGVPVANRYTFSSASSYYIDNYLYTGTINSTNQPCSNSSVYAERTIHNSSTTCSCINSAWKCWSMTAI